MSVTDSTLGFIFSALHGVANFVGVKDVPLLIEKTEYVNDNYAIVFSVAGVNIEFRAHLKRGNGHSKVIQHLEYRTVNTFGEWRQVLDGFYLTDGGMVHQVAQFDPAFLRRGVVPLLPTSEAIALFQSKE